MIETPVLLTYAAIVLGFVFLPGPATLMAMASAAQSGKKAGLATVAGLAVGDLLHTALAIFGISAAIAASALLFSIIKYLGAGYLIWMGIMTILSRSSPDLPVGGSAVTPAIAFRTAVIAEVLNPKTALFFLSFLPQFVDPTLGAIGPQLALLGGVYVCLAMISTAIFALSAGHLGQMMRQNPVVLRWQNKVVGGIYCALGAKIAMADR